MHNTFFKVVNLPQNKRQKAIIKTYIVLKKKNSNFKVKKIKHKII